MKKIILTAALALLASSAYAQSITPLISQTVGAGSNESYLVINFEDSPSGANNPATDFAFGYKWDTGDAPTGIDMLLALKSAISPQFVNEGFDSGLGYYISGFSYGGVTQIGATDPNGYWTYWTGLDGQTWAYSGVGVGSRTLTNGSWDGWTWDNDYQDDPVPVNGVQNPGGELFAPITPAAAPEPSAAWVFALGAGTLGVAAIRRRRRA